MPRGEVLTEPEDIVMWDEICSICSPNCGTLEVSPQRDSTYFTDNFFVLTNQSSLGDKSLVSLYL